MTDFRTWDRSTLEQFAQEARDKLVAIETREVIRYYSERRCTNNMLRCEMEEEIERNRAAIAELVGALVAAEELYRVGLIYAKDGLIEEVVNLRQAALTKYQQPPISEQSTKKE